MGAESDAKRWRWPVRTPPDLPSSCSCGFLEEAEYRTVDSETDHDNLGASVESRMTCACSASLRPLFTIFSFPNELRTRGLFFSRHGEPMLNAQFFRCFFRFDFAAFHIWQSDCADSFKFRILPIVFVQSSPQTMLFSNFSRSRHAFLIDIPFSPCQDGLPPFLEIIWMWNNCTEK